MIKLTIKNKQKLLNEIRGNHKSLKDVVKRMSKGYLETYLVDIFGDKNRFALRSEVKIGLTDPNWFELQRLFNIDENGISSWKAPNPRTGEWVEKKKKIGKHLNDVVRVVGQRDALSEELYQHQRAGGELKRKIRNAIDELSDNLFNKTMPSKRFPRLDKDFTPDVDKRLIEFFGNANEEYEEVARFMRTNLWADIPSDRTANEKEDRQDYEATIITYLFFFANSLDTIIQNEKGFNLPKTSGLITDLSKALDERDNFALEMKAISNKKMETEIKAESFGIKAYVRVDRYRKLQQWWNRNSEEALKDLRGESDSSESYVYIFSKHPIDVLRMSDHDGLTSCHSPTQGYFRCAVDDAKGGGAIVYLITSDQFDILNEVNSNWEKGSEEIFYDKDRADSDIPSDLDRVVGDTGQDMDPKIAAGKINPAGRFRIRRIVEYKDKKPLRDFGLPESRFYKPNPSPIERSVEEKLLKEITIILRDLQKEVFQSNVEDMGDLKLAGGDYQDTSATKMLTNFFGKKSYYYDEDFEIHPLEETAKYVKQYFYQFDLKGYVAMDEDNTGGSGTNYLIYSKWAEDLEDRRFPEDQGMPWSVKTFEGGRNGNTIELQCEDPYEKFTDHMSFSSDGEIGKAKRTLYMWLEDKFDDLIVEELGKGVEHKGFSAKIYNLAASETFNLIYEPQNVRYKVNNYTFKESTPIEEMIKELKELIIEETEKAEKSQGNSKLRFKNVGRLVARSYAGFLVFLERSSQKELDRLYYRMYKYQTVIENTEKILEDVISAIKKFEPDYKFDYKRLQT